MYKPEDRVQGTSANDVQVGGSHYASGLQHWDLVETYGLGYLEGCATKYVTRARKKNGEQDVRKAMHFVAKLTELYDAGTRKPRGIVPLDVVDAFCKANQLNTLESAIIQTLCCWCTKGHLQLAAKDLEDLLASVQTG